MNEKESKFLEGVARIQFLYKKVINALKDNKKIIFSKDKQSWTIK